MVENFDYEEEAAENIYKINMNRHIRVKETTEIELEATKVLVRLSTIKPG